MCARDPPQSDREYRRLARTVSDAREGLALGTRTGDPSSATPIAQIVSDDTPRIELAPKIEPTAPTAPVGAVGRMLGLRHRLPFFGRKRG